MLRKPGNRARGGFTLTEIAIVLGVIGIILGAIWAAASRTNDANKVQKATGQVMQILNNYRTLYAQRGVDVSDGTDVTCQGVTNNYFPSEMVIGACTTATTSTYPVTPWNNGGYAQILGYQSVSGILIIYTSLPQTACNNLMASLTTSPDLMYENINGTAQYLPPYAATTVYTLPTINGLCVAGSGNYIEVMYPAK